MNLLVTNSLKTCFITIFIIIKFVLKGCQVLGIVTSKVENQFTQIRFYSHQK